jgi:hypothetical protein
MRKDVKDHQVNLLTWDDPSFGMGSYENGDQREENQRHGQILICILST